MRIWKGIRVGVLGAIAAVAIAPAVAVAAPFNVTTTADGDDKECLEDCTLREAVTLAGSADQVNVPRGTYVLTGGELFLTSDTIVGADARTTIVDGDGRSRVLWVTDGTTQVSGVTIRNGNGAGREPVGNGGGIYVQSGLLQLTDSTVTANTGTTGAGIGAAGAVFLIGSTVSGNTASGGRLTRGGGIAATGELGLGNSTVSNNTAIDQVGALSQGGGVYSAGSLSIINATIAGNNANEGGGLYVVAPQTGSPNSDDSIFSAGNGGACSGPGVAAMTGDQNIVSDGTCQFKGSGNRLDTNPRIAGLTNNGGPTNTHALLPASPAINTAGSCVAFDQRGVARPQPVGGLCDVGAFEYRAPTLRVVTTVVNDSGGALTPGAFTVHVRLGATDVQGSPQPGTEKGSTYTVDAGQTYSVVVDGPAGYSIAIGGDCAPNGNVGLIEGQNKTCTVTANDLAPTLTVVTNVVNDQGGVLAPADFDVHVRRGGVDVSGSPKKGSAAGVQYAVGAGAHDVAATDRPGYAQTRSRECTATYALGQSYTCTVTLNDGAPQLTVVTRVVNDDGGTAAPGDFDVSVKLDGQEVPNSPQAGSAAGTAYSLAADTYTVAAGGVAGYAITTSDGCAADGSVTLAVGDDPRTCTVTADDVEPTLTVVTEVANDDGGTATPGAFGVHVRRGGSDVAGSPQPGSASGTTYAVDAGVHTVGADAVAGYGLAVGGDCAPDGSVTLAAGDSRTCTVTANDVPTTASPSPPLPPPVPKKQVNALPAGGTVKVKLPDSDGYVRLDSGEQIPVGTVLDLRKGRVTLVAATDSSGGTATADFYGGIARLSQSGAKTLTTVLTLVERLACGSSGRKAITAAKGKKKRRLWGDGSGRFRTKGKHSAATVVGTKWLVEDRCASTLTRVVRGRVSVRDFAKKKTVTVRAGKKYVARAKKT